MSATIERDGFELVPGVLSATEVGKLKAELERLGIAPGHRRLMEKVPSIGELAIQRRLLSILKEKGGRSVFPVRSIFFDKTPGANWLVPWHQDLSIAVRQKILTSGYGPWSMKDGVDHVQPPVEVLEALLTVRLHLDDCDQSNGALRVIPGSHKSGRLDTAEITHWRAKDREIVCSAKAGDALLMKPLLLHASSQAAAPSHRRVIHLEYAAGDLSNGLEWDCPELRASATK